MTEVTRLLLVGPEPRELQPVVPERLPESTIELRPIDERLIEVHRLYVHGYALPGRDVTAPARTDRTSRRDSRRARRRARPSNGSSSEDVLELVLEHGVTCACAASGEAHSGGHVTLGA